MTFSLLLGLCYLLQLCKPPDTIADLSFLNSFSSKTSYRHSNLQRLKSLSNEENKCKLVHVNALFRHGTRYPGAEDITKIVQVHRKIIESQSARNLPQSFLDWKPTFSINRAKNLSSVGYEEMMNIGRRFRNQLEKHDGYFDESNHMEVFATSVFRTRQSGEAFLHQFLRGKRTSTEIRDMIKERDSELRFFDNCPYYTKSVLKNKTSKIESQRFANGPEIKKAIEDIRLKWNLKDVNLLEDDVRNLYVMCGYEIANNMSSEMSPHMCKVNGDRSGLDCPLTTKTSKVTETSPLCQLLERSHYSIFEYLYDLKHYWTKAYGRTINWLQSCDLMSPMLEQIINAANGHRKAYKAAMNSNQPLEDSLGKENYLRAVFWFGHAETLLPLAALLNLYNQSSPMTADQYSQRLFLLRDQSERFTTFRVSNIAPFSGNLAIELYHCPHLGNGLENGYFIRIKSNEKTLRLSWANGATQISLQAFIDHLRICSSGNYKHNDVCRLRP